MLQILPDFLFPALGFADLLVKDFIFAVGLYVIHILLAHFPGPDRLVKFQPQGRDFCFFGLILCVFFYIILLIVFQCLGAYFKCLGKFLDF